MAKKRKASNGPSEPKGPRDYNPADARLGPINSYEDIADSEEEYFLNKDQILFDDGPKSKKQKRQDEEEEFLENSDEEALGYDDEGSDDEESEDQDDSKRKPTKSSKARRVGGSEGEDGEEEEGDSGWWGSSRKEYYDADNLETEADAVEEEQEARRLQKKKLAKMSESDFIFDESEWLAPEAEDADQDEVVTEVLKDVEIPADMSAEERYRLLKTRYPEFDYLADELQELQPLLVTIQKQAEGQPAKSLAVVKYRILGCYVATLAMYFATLTSPARDATNGTAKALDPSELRDHEVMGTLLECRDAWKKVEHLKTSDNARAAGSMLSPPEEPTILEEEVEVGTELSKKSSKDPAAKKAKAKAKAEARKAKAIEDSLADLDALVTTKKPKKKASVKMAARDGDSDFGEEETLDAKAAAEKAARKKSLRFYTSQIVQKANRRAEGGRDAGGDMDIPYRERLKDRQARLNAEAENRGKRSAKGADLGEASDEEDGQVANAVRDDEDEYYDMVAARSSKKKEEKASRSAALAAATKADRVVPTEVIGEDGKRKVTYQIEKNKGLAPKRNKLARNPRVKKRKAYEQKQKKLRSMKPVYKAEGRGGYAGELTGIKPGLIKSVKL
ncbi:Sas10 C-terminal domain-containing protein [Hypoxylon cercidicola]|nr:Sas10 C-terminal domain-containing protein [Hypoxylon cercidicola]